MMTAETASASTLTTTTMKVPMPRLYLGTMSFGWSQTSSYVDEVVARKMLERFVQVDGNLRADEKDPSPPRVDTARIYAGGKTEKICGAILDKQTATVTLGTKAHPSQPHGLSRQGIHDQLQASQAACQVESFGEYYLHQPDPDHSLLESLQYLHELVEQGVIQTTGMSNYHVSEMKRAFELCRDHGLTSPTVYQGLYNPLNRLVETELIPLLHQHNCAFVAYNPLAAGLLTGKHKNIDNGNVLKGRFKDNANYLPRFYTAANFNALALIQEQCHRDNISLVDATYGWLLRHSALQADCGDGVLLGASSMTQLDENLQACSKAANNDATLSPELLQAFDKAYELTKDGAFAYWRSYSADMPDRERLDQGAAYQATKK